jgi:hypothetical protein
VNNVDLSAYILGQFETVEEIKPVLPKLRVVYSEDIAKVFGAPALIDHPIFEIALHRKGLDKRCSTGYDVTMWSCDRLVTQARVLRHAQKNILQSPYRKTSPDL